MVAELWDYFKDVESSYKSLCTMFGESHKLIEPDELFTYLADFIAAFKVQDVVFNICHQQKFKALREPVN